MLLYLHDIIVLCWFVVVAGEVVLVLVLVLMLSLLLLLLGVVMVVVVLVLVTKTIAENGCRHSAARGRSPLQNEVHGYGRVFLRDLVDMSYSVRG